MFAGCENILRHAPLQTLLLINLSALCFESNLVQPPEKHSAVSGAWLCFEGRGLLPSQSTARLRCKNTSSQCSTLASGYTPHTWRSNTDLKTSLASPGLSLASWVRHSRLLFKSFVHAKEEDNYFTVSVYKVHINTIPHTYALHQRGQSSGSPAAQLPGEVLMFSTLIKGT